METTADSLITLFLIMLSACILSVCLERNRFYKLSKTRPAITFAEFREEISKDINPVIIQECWITIKDYIPDKKFSLKSADNLRNDYKFCDDTLEEIFEELAEKLKIPKENTRDNPFYNKVNTVGDMIAFVDAQSKMNTPPAI